ncbi:hypothetical protein FACS189413_03720 [Bacteroidia bacterium]|nr:hypothetical protein FACS189413_03720 [Bacteroidia bacterium]
MNKHRIILIVFVLLGTVASHAQFQFGVKAGMNNSKATLNGLYAQQLRVEDFFGFQAGPIIEYVTPSPGLRMGFDLAVLYSMEGFKLAGATLENFETQAQSYQANSLLIPLNLKAKLLVKEWGLYVTAGPYARFPLNRNLEQQYETQTFGCGLNGSVGLQLGRHFQIGLNYQLSLTDDYSKLKLLTVGDIPDYISEINGRAVDRTISITYFF